MRNIIMKDWKLRGRENGAGPLVEVTLQAESWADAVAQATAGLQRLVVRDAVRVGLEELAIARLCTNHRWKSYADHEWKWYREAPLFTTKDYATAVGPRRAVIRPVVPDNGLGQLWLVGEYISEGNNALVGTMAIIPQDAPDDVVYKLVDRFADDVSHRISETYAARLLKPS
ncbi:hypothetical protein DIE18_04175 [Burkholderia sp. Bp9125]|nr:hypothetical protein DIE18_04175 [Burkholderia sp. Bp9125]